MYLERNKGLAAIYPSTENIYSSVSYLSMNYGDATKVLKFSIFLLYGRPEPVINPNFPLIMSNFTMLSDAWIPSRSKFKFSDNINDAKYAGLNIYGTIMFCEFEQGVMKTEDCKADCSNQNYVLEAAQ